MLQALIIAVLTAGTLGVLMAPQVRKAKAWRATVTPLASIIGSGFLVLGPILADTYGKYAPLVMLALCVAAYAFGAAIRSNIRTIASQPERTALERRIEGAASWSLAFAYCISVAYYLNLFGAFFVKMTPLDSPVAAHVVTSITLIVILAVGWMKGFAAMERMEQVSVSLKLAIIAGLLAGLVIHFAQKAAGGELILAAPSNTGWSGIALGLGLIITVQGFETSRYLGDEYEAGLRIRSMRYAQWLSAAIYMVYVVLLTYLFDTGDIPLTETAIVDMMHVVSAILPPLLVAAALSAQFSAAIADTSGAGGLAEELSKGRFSPRIAYLVLVLIGLGLTWFAHIFEIITYASKAFALYYALQCAIAIRAALRAPRSPGRAALYSLFLLTAIAVLAFGRPVEGAG
ncbi:MAG: hypothetical protein KDA53_11690 [Hyphomonas sp.]|nr:hypothetical protein [Hyphomonas sp.]